MARLAVQFLASAYVCFLPAFGQPDHGLPERSVNRREERLPEFTATTTFDGTSAPVALRFPIYKVNQFITTQPQNEPSIRISPKSRDHIVAAYRDFRLGSNPAIRQVGIANSTDGGLTWAERLFTYSNHDRTSDPGVAVDTAGTFYVIGLSYLSTDPDSIGNALALMKSADGGVSWFSVSPAIDRVPNVFEDREMIYVDDSPTSPYSGNMYVSWTRFFNAGGPTNIYCVRSTNGGSSFENPVRVSDVGNVQHSMPTTGPNGEVYVAWADAATIWVDISTDGGKSFGSDKAVSTSATTPMFFGTIVGNAASGLRVSGYPSLAVDKTFGPRRGHVYAVWMTRNAGDCDIVCSSSTDRGATWNAPVRVNDDAVGNGRDQFFSWVSVGDRGYVDIVSLDRRHDPANLLCDAYFAQSRDGGSTFTNHRLTSESFDPGINYNADTRFGDYMGIDARSGRIVPVFTATTLGNQDIYVAILDELLSSTPPQEAGSAPRAFRLEQNYPNPFNSSSNIRYLLPALSISERQAGISELRHVKLVVYDMLGREVSTLVNEMKEPGTYTVEFPARGGPASSGDGSGLSSGIYFYRLRAGSFVDTKRMLLIR